jgi:hypothetical protein
MNQRRFGRHEEVIKDDLPASAVRFAGLVMHRFRPDLGYAEISIGYAEKKLKMLPRTVNRGRDALVDRGWIVKHETSEKRRSSNGLPLNPPSRYGLGGGPEDLLFE